MQDNLPPFSMAEARRAVEEALGGKLEDHFAEFGPAVAAASIAQVHKAAVIDADGQRREVAVKILRPGIERQFRRDLDSYYFAARLIERLHRADAPPEAGRRGRHAEGLDRARDGFAPRGRGHLRDGGEHRRATRTSACRRSTGSAPPGAC